MVKAAKNLIFVFKVKTIITNLQWRAIVLGLKKKFGETKPADQKYSTEFVIKYGQNIGLILKKI